MVLAPFSRPSSARSSQRLISRHQRLRPRQHNSPFNLDSRTLYLSRLVHTSPVLWKCAWPTQHAGQSARLVGYHRPWPGPLGCPPDQDFARAARLTRSSRIRHASRRCSPPVVSAPAPFTLDLARLESWRSRSPIELQPDISGLPPARLQPTECAIRRTYTFLLARWRTPLHQRVLVNPKCGPLPFPPYDEPNRRARCNEQ